MAALIKSFTKKDIKNNENITTLYYLLGYKSISDFFLNASFQIHKVLSYYFRVITK